jgi:riboflavin biosynthesis pyrimidine reductase
MEPGSLVTEEGEVIAPDPAETRLRELYAADESMAIRLSMIQAADRLAVGLDGTSRSLNGPEDLRILKVTRSLADVVIVGARTARVEDYGDIRIGAELRAARESAGQDMLPDLAIVTRNGKVPEGLDPARTWIFTTEWGRALSVDGPLAKRTLAVGKNEIEVARLIGYLWLTGHRHMLCEGGPELARILMSQHLVNEFCLTTSPQPGGKGPKVPPVPQRMWLEHTLTGGGYTMERWQGLS